MSGGAAEPSRGLPSGAFDLYCHTAPCVLPRAADAFDVARRAAEAGMAGVVFHNHHEGTVGRAAVAARAAPGLLCLGGVVLNEYSGGLSRKTAHVALRAGARFVWMPTTDARHHARRLGRTGRSVATVFDPLDDSPGLALLEGGRPRRELDEIVRTVAEFGGIIGTGHADAEEIEALAELTRRHGVPLVVNHPYFLLDEPLAFFQRLAAEGVYFELPSTDRVGTPSVPAVSRYVALIRAVGSDRCVVGSECLAPHHPVERLAVFAEALRAEALAAADVQAVFAETPRPLLGLPPSS